MKMSPPAALMAAAQVNDGDVAVLTLRQDTDGTGKGQCRLLGAAHHFRANAEP